jgi:hypothetical protein
VQKVFMRPVEPEASGRSPWSRTISAPGLPFFTFKGVAAVARIQKFRVQRNNRRNTLSVQPCDKTIDIDKVLVDTLQMYNIRLQLPDNPQQACR